MSYLGVYIFYKSTGLLLGSYCMSLESKFDNTCKVFFKGAQVGGRTWVLFDFRLFFSHKQRLGPLGYCAPLTLVKFSKRDLDNKELATKMSKRSLKGYSLSICPGQVVKITRLG